MAVVRIFICNWSAIMMTMAMIAGILRVMNMQILIPILINDNSNSK